ncbi:MAG: response regulator, partial [Alphaproteobacteria bacterium]
MTSNILVVDDTPANLRLMQHKLGAGFYQVDTASSGQQALDILKTSQNNIVLLDVMMPGMDGFEVCRRLKGDPDTQQISVIMVTSLNDAASRVKGLEAGADDFISRPIQDDILFARIRSLENLGALIKQVDLRAKTAKKLGFDTSLPNLSQTDFANAKILLAEPDTQQATKIASNLKDGLQSHVLTCGVVDQILSYAQAEPVEILMINADHEKTSDGIRAAMSFRAMHSARNTPIILLFDQLADTRAEAALQVGISDYMHSDVDPGELIARVKNQLKRQRHLQALERIYETSINKALTDDLTGLYSRRYVSQHLPNIVSETQMAGKPLAILMIDTDDFKSINDQYGHASGDLVLAHVAKRISENLREDDIVAR